MKTLHSPLTYFLMVVTIFIGLNLGAYGIVYAVDKSTNFAIELVASETVRVGIMMCMGLLFTIAAGIGLWYFTKHIYLLHEESKRIANR